MMNFRIAVFFLKELFVEHTSSWRPDCPIDPFVFFLDAPIHFSRKSSFSNHRTKNRLKGAQNPEIFILEQVPLLMSGFGAPGGRAISYKPTPSVLHTHITIGLQVLLLLQSI